MASIIDRNNVPCHVFSIPELDLSDDLFSEALIGPWFRLGARTINVNAGPDEEGVEKHVFRYSMLINPGDFAAIFDELEYIGDQHFDYLGKSGSAFIYKDEKKIYQYIPFYSFKIGPNSVNAEPLVFTRTTPSADKLFVNPDLLIYFQLDEKALGSGTWWDLPKATEAVLHRVIKESNVEIVDIRIEYLRKYLQTRQMTLIVGHFRGLTLLNPSQSEINEFTECELALGSLEQGAKAILQNWERLENLGGLAPTLDRRLHLWFQIPPPVIDLPDPWAPQPPFDPYEFTLPTRVGLVAPVRHSLFRPIAGRTFDGEECDSQELVCFRQEVLAKI
jgi:hypothetical protein